MYFRKMAVILTATGYAGLIRATRRFAGAPERQRAPARQGNGQAKAPD